MWMWFIIAIGLLIVELSTVELVAIWFALSSLVLGVLVSIFPEMPMLLQVAIFVILSGILVLSTRKLVKKITARKKGQETNLELVVGHTARVVEKIDNEREVGAVKINGLIWSARSENNEVIENDTLVTIKEIKGNKAIVFEKE